MKITIELLEKWGSCYSRAQHETFFAGRESLTPIEIAELTDVPAEDRLWVLLREDIIPARELRLLACNFAESALSLIDNPDPRSINAVAVSRKFANGEATIDELDSAWIAAWIAAQCAARGAAQCAAQCAARSAAQCAAWIAAQCAFWSFLATARRDAWSAARYAQLKMVVDVLNKIYKTDDNK